MNDHTGLADTDKRPHPPVAPEVDLRDFPYMRLDVVRLRDSELAAVDDAEVFRASVLSWCVAWHQVPAGSLPDDDAWLARALGYGRDLKTWRRLRGAGALRGWFSASDGRLYHAVVAEKVNEAWMSRMANVERRQQWRARKARQRGNSTEEVHGTGPETSRETSDNVPRDVPRDIATNREERRGDREETGNPTDTPSLPVGAAQARPSPRGSRLPQVWPLTDELRAIASETRIAANLPPIDVDTEHAAFLDYWHAKAGKDACKVDWTATWRSWCRKSNAGIRREGRSFGEGMRSQIADAMSIIDPPDDTSAAVDAWNALAAKTGLPQVQAITDARKQVLQRRLHDCGGIDGWNVALGKVEASKFLTGGNDRGWCADFDFVIREATFTKLMEGKYDDREPRDGDQFRNGFSQLIAEGGI